MATKITYTQQGDYLLPDLKLPEQPKIEIGIWGKRHLRYLEKHHPIIYTSLLTSCKLTAYLADIDEQAEDMFFRLVNQLAKQEGVTEQLKADNKEIHYFSCSNYKKDTRGNCETRHYIRADAIEQVVMLELRRLAKYLESHEEEFAKLLAEKTNADMLAEQKTLETELNRATARNEMLTSLFAKTYEDNVSGKLSDEMYMELSHKYEVERLELKTKIFEYKERLAKISEMEQNKDDFLKAVRKFMEMDSLTAPMLRELIDHIDVYEKEGGKKNYTQRIVIYYRFVGYLELPTSEDENYKANTRKGVDVEYIPTAKSA